MHQRRRGHPAAAAVRLLGVSALLWALASGSAAAGAGGNQRGADSGSGSSGSGSGTPGTTAGPPSRQAAEPGRGVTGCQRATNATNATAVPHDELHIGRPSVTPIIFLFGAFAIGAMMRQVMRNSDVPYTVCLLLSGLAFGGISANVSEVQYYTTLTRMDPHLIFYIFLPPLIFHSAFAMDVHTFKKMTGQIVRELGVVARRLAG